MAKSIVKNLFAKGILSIFNALIPLLIIPYVYRILGPDIIGKIEYATALYTYFGLLGLLGIYNYGLREVSRYRNDKAKISDLYRNLFAIGFISNLFFFVVYELIVFFFIENAQLRQIMYLLGLQLIAQIFYVEWVNEAYEDFRFITVKTIIIRLLSVAGIFLVVHQPQDYLLYVWIFVGVIFFNNLLSFLHVGKYVSLNFKVGNKLNIWPYLFPLFIVLVLNNTNILYTLADRTMLGMYTNADQVAYYSVGQKISEMMKILLLSVAYVALPRMSLYLEENHQLYQASVRKLMHLVLMLMLPISMGMFLLAEPIVMLFAGREYAGAIPAMQVFAIRMVFTGIESILYNNIIFLHRKEKTLLLFNLCCGGLNVLFNFFFLKSFSPFVAILITLCCEVIFQLLCLRYIKHVLQLGTGIFDKENLRYLLLALSFIPIVGLLRLLTHNFYSIICCSILLCGGFYIAMLLLLKDQVMRDIKDRLLCCFINKSTPEN